MRSDTRRGCSEEVTEKRQMGKGFTQQSRQQLEGDQSLMVWHLCLHRLIHPYTERKEMYCPFYYRVGINVDILIYTFPPKKT